MSNAQTALPKSGPGIATRALRLVLASLGAACTVNLWAAQPQCPDMILGTDELTGVLDQTLGNLRGMVDQREVSIVPEDATCYLHIRLSSAALAQLGGACRLQACSTLLHQDKSLALRDFDVTGCDVLFDGMGLSRHVASHIVDASARIRQQCGSDDFIIGNITLTQIGGQPKLRFRFRTESLRH